MKQRGFTLVELLVALAIMALLVLASYRALSTLLESERDLARAQEKWQGLRLAFDRMEADLQRALPRRARLLGGTEAAFVGLSDAAGGTSFRFTRSGSSSEDPGLGGQRVEYRYADGRLELLLWPALDNAPGATPQTLTLIEGVAALRAKYAARDGQWYGLWPIAQDTTALPRAIDLELDLAAGETLHRVVVLP